MEKLTPLAAGAGLPARGLLSQFCELVSLRKDALTFFHLRCALELSCFELRRGRTERSLPRASQQIITFDRSHRPRHQNARAVSDGEIAGAVTNGKSHYPALLLSARGGR